MNYPILNIYTARFLSSFSLFLFVPFYPIWLLHEKLLSGANIAIAMTLVILSLRSASLIFAHVIKKYHQKYVSSISLIVAITVFLTLFILVQLHISFVLLWYIVSLLLGTSIAVTSLSLLSAVALYLEEDSYRSGFSYMNIALNLSAGIGSLIGAIIVHYNIHLLPLAPIVFSILAIFFSMRIPIRKIHQSSQPSSHNQEVSSKIPFIIFTIVGALTYAGYAQFYDIFPLYAQSIIGVQTVGVLFFVSSITIVLLQGFFTKLFAKVRHDTSSIIGNIIFAFGIFLLLFANQGLILLCTLGVIILSIGEIIYVPAYQAMAVKLYRKSNPVMALAIMMTGWGVAESLASFCGIYLSLHQLGVYSYVIGSVLTIIPAIAIYFYIKVE